MIRVLGNGCAIVRDASQHRDVSRIYNVHKSVRNEHLRACDAARMRAGAVRQPLGRTSHIHTPRCREELQWFRSSHSPK